MANIAWAVQQITEKGITPTYNTPTITDTYQIPNDGRTFVHVKKTGANACNVTALSQGTVGPGNLTIGNEVISVPATTGDRMIGPFPPSIFNDGSGLVNVTFSEVTGLTAAVLRL